MRALRIVFMGTPDFAVPTLDALLREGYEVVGVITAPDKPAGRGRKLHESAVKRYARDKGLTLLQPTNLKDPDFQRELASLKANLQIVVAFRMLPRAVWEMPEYGTVNLHASLLPQYRGAAPINWAIINGETETGVTTFYINERIDTGEIILQEKTSIDPDENAGLLHDRLMQLGAGLILKTVELIAKGEVKPVIQSESAELKAAPKIHRDTCKIDWTEPGQKIFNKIRGLSPYPASWSNLYNPDKAVVLKVYQATFREEDHGLEPGKLVLTNNELKVAVADGFILLQKIQVSGKKKMSVKEFLNGHQIHNLAKLG
ncbi:methionyl-tRNA formyltransferase [Lentiprolixibacter aurantiacus]|uniref:Methionyl-tRNA formyltransferase n=1 Tax=Lentiprolixibacter aurantiacus TaxID=2993939 RepID=A0AAE3SNM7_9FLAO|nr:methionyl-tRNA formyltransferase [Lentiprolixibacter aurantiacus]MCX2719804.1 methionyl-tRNA formyltransferase [Lentiprolixibacter aurantiacus]